MNPISQATNCCGPAIDLLGAFLSQDISAHYSHCLPLACNTLWSSQGAGFVVGPQAFRPPGRPPRTPASTQEQAETLLPSLPRSKGCSGHISAGQRSGAHFVAAGKESWACQCWLSQPPEMLGATNCHGFA